MKCTVEISMNTLYVFHMLSVANCSYDNEYGAKYRRFHDSADLSLLKKHEKLITAVGGQYSGQLMFLICLPASLKENIKTLYGDIKSIFNGQPDKAVALREYPPQLLSLNIYNSEINEICDVFIRNYDVFAQALYPIVIEEIKPYAAALQQMLDESHLFFASAQQMTQISYPFDKFVISLTNSMDNGPEAIDITNQIDVFGINRPLACELAFIQHEFIIYLFKNAFLGNYQLEFSKMWPILEGLAEFYLDLSGARITGFFGNCREQMEFYRAEYAQNAALLPQELFDLALRHFLG